MTRNKHPEETVKLIMDVATKLFIEKGYENTSLQNILDETKLSKGAIYHHFSSKDDIFEAIANKIGNENCGELIKIRDDKTLNGKEKLKSIFRAALFHPSQRVVLNVAPKLLDNPRFLAAQIKDTFGVVAPDFIEPILQQGMEDGSIPIKEPKELAEALLILTNVWLNPLIHIDFGSSFQQRCRVFRVMLEGIGIDIIDDEMIEQCSSYFQGNESIKE